MVDANGLLVPRAKIPLRFGVTGAATLVATDNGDATSFEPFQSKERNAFNGLCLVVIRSTGQPGSILLKATSSGLQPAQVKIQAKPAPSK